MKKNKILILSVVLLAILPLKISAFSGSVSISCDKTVLGAGETTTCHINGNATDGPVYAVNVKAVSGANLSIESSSKDSSWEGSAEGANFDVYTDNLRTGSFSIGSITIKAGDKVDVSSSISLSGASFNYMNGTEKVESSVSGNQVTVRIASNNADLNDLQVDGTSVLNSMSFTTNNESVSITASPSDSHSKVSGTGRVNLGYGDNKANVVVTAENGTTKTYTITIKRNDDRSTNNNLKDLRVSKGTLRFNERTTSYTVEVDTDVESITIDGSAKDSKSTVSGTGTKNLRLGRNRFDITVTAENGSTKVYTVTVNRKDNRSSNNNLKSLTLSSGKIDFKSDKTEYELAVDYEVDKISFEAEAEDEKSKITGLEEQELQVGENVINIRVTAENESVKTYKLTIIRNIEVIETVYNKAKNITIKSHKFNFDPDVTQYTLETRLHELEINVELEHENSKYEITGNENLHDGSLVQITITDEDGNSNIYTITIYNPTEANEGTSFFDLPIFKIPKYILYITIAVSTMLVIILAWLVSKESKNIKHMLSKKHVHEDCTPEDYENNPLYGEPTYETLEMAKIDLEDYLSEERRAKRKNGIEESEEDIRNIRSELEEKIAILEDAENAIEEIKKSKETMEKAAEDLEVTAINIETIDLDDYEESEEEIKPIQTRTSKRSSEKLDLISNEDQEPSLETTDDIDDIISTNILPNQEEVPSSKQKEDVKPQEESKTSKKKTNKSSEKDQTEEQPQKSTTTKKKKNKKKKSTSKSTTTKSSTKKKNNDDLLDQILSQNYNNKTKK